MLLIFNDKLIYLVRNKGTLKKVPKKCQLSTKKAKAKRLKTPLEIEGSFLLLRPSTQLWQKNHFFVLRTVLRSGFFPHSHLHFTSLHLTSSKLPTDAPTEPPPVRSTCDTFFLAFVVSDVILSDLITFYCTCSGQS